LYRGVHDFELHGGDLFDLRGGEIDEVEGVIVQSAGFSAELIGTAKGGVVENFLGLDQIVAYIESIYL
jgi:hypothetical protein